MIYYLLFLSIIINLINAGLYSDYVITENGDHSGFIELAKNNGSLCGEYQIECDDNGSITSIKWSGRVINANGDTELDLRPSFKIPEAIWLIPTLKIVEIENRGFYNHNYPDGPANEKIHVSIPAFNTQLETLKLYRVILTSPLPSFPSSLKIIYFKGVNHESYFDANIDEDLGQFPSLPSAIERLELRYTDFLTDSLLSNVPSIPLWFEIQNNKNQDESINLSKGIHNSHAYVGIGQGVSLSGGTIKQPENWRRIELVPKGRNFNICNISSYDLDKKFYNREDVALDIPPFKLSDFGTDLTSIHEKMPGFLLNGAGSSGIYDLLCYHSSVGCFFFLDDSYAAHGYPSGWYRDGQMTPFTDTDIPLKELPILKQNFESYNLSAKCHLYISKKSDSPITFNIELAEIELTPEQEEELNTFLTKALKKGGRNNKSKKEQKVFSKLFEREFKKSISQDPNQILKFNKLARKVDRKLSRRQSRQNGN